MGWVQNGQLALDLNADQALRGQRGQRTVDVFPAQANHRRER